MKISSRILVTLLVLVGIAFLVMLTRAYAAGRVKCQGNSQLRIALDANGCESLEPWKVTQQQMDAMLKAAGVGQECYKLRFWSKPDQNGIDHLEAEVGDLDLVKCVANDSDTSKMTTMQPHGGGATQRVMFNTPTARQAFERETKAAKK